MGLLEAAFVRTLRDSHIDVASELLLRIQGHTPPHAEPAVRTALARMGHPDRLLPLHEALESGSCERDAAERVLVLLGDRVPEAPCALLSMAKAERTRRLYVDVLVKIGLAAVEPALQHLQSAPGDARAYFARVLSQIRDPRAAMALMALSRSGTPALRKEALRGLVAVDDPRAHELLLRASLDDADESVRIVALRCLGGTRRALNCETLIDRLTGSAALADEEKDLLYGAIAATNQPEGAEFFARCLRTGWLRGRSDRATWQRAASALARMTLPQARETLEAGARSRSRDLAQVCAHALHGLETSR